MDKAISRGRERLENEPKSGRRISKTTKEAEAKLKELLKTDAIYTLREFLSHREKSVQKIGPQNLPKDRVLPGGQ